MAAKAEQLFPELRQSFAEDEPLTPCLVFVTLLPFVRDAHERADEDSLRRAYGFAQWCHHQRPGSELPNAVGVAFYEHLFDDWSLRSHVVPWLAPEVRRAIMPLWEHRLTDEQAEELRSLLDEPAAEHWRQPRAVAGGG